MVHRAFFPGVCTFNLLCLLKPDTSRQRRGSNGTETEKAHDLQGRGNASKQRLSDLDRLGHLCCVLRVSQARIAILPGMLPRYL